MRRETKGARADRARGSLGARPLVIKYIVLTNDATVSIDPTSSVKGMLGGYADVL